MTCDIHPISVRLVLDNMALMTDHANEVSSFGVSPQPNREEYLALEAAGILLSFGAFADGKLVGYSVNAIKRHMHYDIRCAYNTALFVHPDHRATPLGLRIMAETRKGCKAWGASRVFWHAKPDSPLNTLFVRKKTKVQDIVYEEQL